MPGPAGVHHFGRHPPERVRPTRRATPLLLTDLRLALQQIELWQFPQAVIGRRDAALLLMGFAGAFRRSELTALTVAAVALHPQDGLHVRMRRSRTDQEGRGAVKALPYGTNPDTCPPCTYLRWRQVLDAADTDVVSGYSEHSASDRATAPRQATSVGPLGC